MSPPPGYVAYGEPGAYAGQYQSIGRISRAMVVLLWIYVPLQLLSVFDQLRLSREAKRFLDGEITEDAFRDAVEVTPSSIVGLMIVPIAVLTMIWMYRMAANLRKLGRAGQTGAPVAVSGGAGHRQEGSTSEARVAAKIAADEFGRPIRWVEGESRDTRENATMTMALLKPAGINHVILVTHGYHMAAGPGIQVEAAPMGLAKNVETPTLEWLPSSAGFREMRQLLRELVGSAAGA